MGHLNFNACENISCSGMIEFVFCFYRCCAVVNRLLAVLFIAAPQFSSFPIWFCSKFCAGTSARICTSMLNVVAYWKLCRSAKLKGYPSPSGAGEYYSCMSAGLCRGPKPPNAHPRNIGISPDSCSSTIKTAYTFKGDSQLSKFPWERGKDHSVAVELPTDCGTLVARKFDDLPYSMSWWIMNSAAFCVVLHSLVRVKFIKLKNQLEITNTNWLPSFIVGSAPTMSIGTNFIVLHRESNCSLSSYIAGAVTCTHYLQCRTVL